MATATAASTSTSAIASRSRPRRYDAGARRNKVRTAAGTSTMPMARPAASGHAMRHSWSSSGSRWSATARVRTAPPSTPPTAAAPTRVQSSRTRVSWKGPFEYQCSRIAAASAPTVVAAACPTTSSTGASFHAAAPATASAPATTGPAQVRGADSRSATSTTPAEPVSAGVRMPPGWSHQPQRHRPKTTIATSTDGSAVRTNTGARRTVVACGMTSTKASSGPVARSDATNRTSR